MRTGYPVFRILNPTYPFHIELSDQDPHLWKTDPDPVPTKKICKNFFINFCLFEGWERQKYSFPSPRVSLGGTRSFLSKNLPEHCTANHGVWIKCIFEQLDRNSNVVVWYKLARRRKNILHKQSSWILLRRNENFCWLRWCQTRGKNCACTRQRATSNKSLYTL